MSMAEKFTQVTSALNTEQRLRLHQCITTAALARQCSRAWKHCFREGMAKLTRREDKDERSVYALFLSLTNTQFDAVVRAVSRT